MARAALKMLKWRADFKELKYCNQQHERMLATIQTHPTGVKNSSSTVAPVGFRIKNSRANPPYIGHARQATESRAWTNCGSTGGTRSVVNLEEYIEGGRYVFTSGNCVTTNGAGLATTHRQRRIYNPSSCTPVGIQSMTTGEISHASQVPSD
ncbi:hypothetical protein BDN70DRAFT_901827 [Pholiota conissans]|uniref:Uncharacterized protein n=1 Tax=Pholiota conissans TaxID=109636 RepID=A0A9P5YJ39_9AGAR|nr:hypothetical protein BDN70DRAFT_901827 [Pholiota conissans]